MRYIERYGIDLKFESRLVAVNGPAREATFAMKGSDGDLQEVTRRFDMLHVCPPQTAPDFVRSSRLLTMPAGLTSTIRRCGTCGMRMSSRSATSVPRRTPRPWPPPGSRLRSWRGCPP